MILKIKFRFLEPYVFNMSGEFSPSGILADNLKVSYPWPSITTLVGALGNVLCSSLNLSLDAQKPWEENLDDILSKTFGKNYKVYGMAVEYNNEEYLPFGNYLINLNDLKNKIKNLCFEEIKKELIKKRKTDIFNYMNKESVRVIEIRHTRKVGIALDYKIKYVKEDYIYFVDYVEYVGKEKINEEKEIAIPGLSFILYINSDKNIDEINNDIVRLGGESRFSEININKIENTHIKFKTLQNLKDKEVLFSKLGFYNYIELESKNNERVLILTSPWILGKDKDIINTPIANKVIKNKIENKINSWLNIEKDKKVHIFGKVVPLGGFDVLRNVRKPINLVLKEGSIIWIE